MIIYSSMPRLEEEKEWCYEAEEWVDILLNWVEFCRRRGMSTTTPLRKFIVCLGWTGLSDQSVQKVHQLVDLLFQRGVPTRCPLETIQHFEFSINGGNWTINDNNSFPIIQQFCHFFQNLPLNITKFTFLGPSDFVSPDLHPNWEPTRLIFSSLSQNQHLTEVTTNIFSPVLTDHLIPSIPLLKTLTFCRFGNIRESSSILMQSVFNGKTSRLRTFIYSNDSLGTPDASELDVEALALLKSNTHLEHLTLDHIKFGDAGALVISDVLTVNKNLRHLGVRFYRLGPRGCMALCEALQVNNTLQSLDLGERTNFLDECAHSLVAALRINRTLQTLGIRNSFAAGMLLNSDMIQLQRIHGIIFWDAAGASLIAEGLKVNKSLKSLEFCGGRVGDQQGHIALAQALQVNNTLEKLILDDIDNAKIVALALASALKINGTLQHLSLNQNRLGNGGASHIARALRGNKSLKRLEMNYCYIGDQGCKALAQALQVNNTLERLALNENKIGDAGVRAFIPTLRINRTLQHLEIKDGLDGRIPSKKTAKTLLQVTSQFPLPVWVSISEVEEEVLEGLHDMNSTAPPPIRLDCASFFKCDFDKRCRELGDGTISDDHASFRWFLPLLGSKRPFVKQTVLFLLLRQRAEVAAQSLQLFVWKEPARRPRFNNSRALLFMDAVATIFAHR